MLQGRRGELDEPLEKLALAALWNRLPDRLPDLVCFPIKAVIKEVQTADPLVCKGDPVGITAVSIGVLERVGVESRYVSVRRQRMR